MSETFTMVMPIYNGVNLLDFAGPREVFSWVTESFKGLEKDGLVCGKPPEVIQILAAANPEMVATRDGLVVKPHKTFDEVQHVDLLWTPDGSVGALSKQMHDDDFLDFLRRISEHATWTTSVCEGALLLAAAGLLDGHCATTHWAFKECFQAYPKITVHEGLPRFVVSGDRVTGGGVSSGIDESLELVRLIWGER